MNKTAVSVAAALCALAATTARADDVQFPGFAHGSQSVTFTVPAQSGPGTHSGTTSAGGFQTHLNGGPTFTSYCVDLYQFISFGPTYNDYIPVGGAHTFLNTHAYDDLASLFAAAAGSVVDAAHEAAFQMAVWEIAYETSGTYNLAAVAGSTASFSASAEATGYANTWLSQLGNFRNAAPIAVLESAGQQDMIYAPIPEPSEIALMLTGLVAIAGVARRRRAKQAD